MLHSNTFRSNIMTLAVCCNMTWHDITVDDTSSHSGQSTADRDVWRSERQLTELCGEVRDS